MKTDGVAYVPAYKRPISEQVGKSWGGLTACRCECGDHCFAFPADDEREQWESVNRSMFRERMREAGLWSPVPPSPQPHVILVSREDEAALAIRRWRVMCNPKKYGPRYVVKRSTVGKALERFICPDAERIVVLSGDGTDLRRCNLRVRTRAELHKRRSN